MTRSGPKPETSGKKYTHAGLREPVLYLADNCTFVAINVKRNYSVWLEEGGDNFIFSI